ncbi:MAG: BREX-3 system phosphatase PglZ [Anaerolineae bacterium]
MKPKRWQDLILRQFGHEQTQSVVIVDPDRLMQDDVLISELQARRYDILNFTTEIAFRNEFEERYRSRWDRGEKTHIVVIVHSSEAARQLPYDLEKKSRVIEIGLHQVFPCLNRIVLTDLDRHYYPALFQAHATLERDNRSYTTESETIRFILRGVFGIDPVALKSPERLVAMLIDKHYAAQAIPPALERYVVEEMPVPLPGDPDPAALFGDTTVFYEWLGRQWAKYVQGILRGETTLRQGSGQAHALDFADHRLRFYSDNLFTERLVVPYPLSYEEIEAVEKLPQEQRWIRAGLAWPGGPAARLFGPGARRRVGEEGIVYVIDVETQLDHFEGLATETLDLRGWLDEGYSWGRLVHDFTLLPRQDYEALQERFVTARRSLNDAFLSFLQQPYPSVSFYDDNKGPIALHRVNQYIHRSVGDKQRVALVVCDGMAVDQWFLLRDYLLACLKRKVEFRENRAYAIAPTVTSVSRQTLFAGRMPGNFPDTALSTTADAKHWQNYWVNQGRRRKRVAYLNLKMAGEFDELRKITDGNNEVLAVVVNFFDDIMHSVKDLKAGKRVFYDTLISYLNNSATDEFFDILLRAGYHVFITSDHGNVDAVGTGVQSPKALVEAYAKRVIIFDQDPIAQAFADKHGLVLFRPLFLPDNLYPVYPQGDGMFASKKSAGISHGGLSIEEMIVPFIEVIAP